MTTRRGFRFGGLAAVLLLVAAGCGGPDADTVSSGPKAGAVPLEVTARLDEHRWLGEPVEVENLVVWPVHTDRPLDIGRFLTLQEAEAKGVAVVREKGGTGRRQAANRPANGSDEAVPQESGGPIREVEQLEQVLSAGAAEVNTLVVENDGDLPILVCAGTIVKGGQQDRQIGQDFVIAAHSTVAVDAFCVEPGRWSVRAGGSVAFCSLGQGVAVKAVRASGQYEKNQGKVWDEVREVLNDTGVQGTDTLVAAREQVARDVAERRAATKKAVLDHFRALEDGSHPPVGFAYAVNGKPVTVRAFAHPRLLEGYLEPFVQAMCLEAELAAPGEDAVETPAKAVTAEDVVAMVKAIDEADQKMERTRAANWNGYRVAEAGFNGACYLADDEDGATDRTIVTVDWTAR